MSNAERIRAMSDEELAATLAVGCHLTDTPTNETCKILKNGGGVDTCAKCLLDWLRKEADNG